MALDVECVVDRGMSGEKQAYRRGDALEKPRKLMEARANYCEPKGLKRLFKSANASRSDARVPALVNLTLLEQFATSAA